MEAIRITWFWVAKTLFSTSAYPKPEKKLYEKEMNHQKTKKTSMKWISYQISTSYNELYLINSGISGREREKERERERNKEREMNFV